MVPSTPTLLIVALLFAAVSSDFPSRLAADTLPECPYPCLPPPTSADTNLPPPPPPAVSGLPYPPPRQPYTAGYLPPPSGTSYVPGYVPPGFGGGGFNYPVPPPPPNPIMPYFPFYFRAAKSAAPPKDSGALVRSMLVCFFILFY